MRVTIQGIQGGFCEIPLAKIHVKSPRFGINESVEITVGVSENLRLADLLLGNDLFQANSKLKDPIEVVNFDVSASPDMDKATSSESIGNQMSETVVPSSDQIVEFGLTRADSEIVVIQLKSLQSLGHSPSIHLRLMTEILV